jgi:hypothetical protein
MDKSGQNPPRTPHGPNSREARLAQALRANLKRRKQPPPPTPPEPTPTSDD